MLFIIFPGFFTNSADALADDRTIDSIIRNVQTNEVLYQNIDIRCSSRYRLTDKTHIVPGVVEKDEFQYRFIQRDPKVYLNMKAFSKTVDGKTVDQSQTVGFDGMTQRGVYGQNLCNINNEKSNPYYTLLLPHTTALNKIQLVEDPLWRLLQGTGLIPFKGKGDLSERELRSTYMEDEKIDGNDCVVVRLHTIDPDSKTKEKLEDYHYFIYLWLAVDRNYLPIQMMRSFQPAKDLSKSDVFCQLKDLREISPGIWFPYFIEYKTYDSYILSKEHRHVQDTFETFKIESVRLNPDVPDSLFSDIECPKSHYLYVVKNGEIVESRKPYAHSSFSSSSYLRKPWVIATIVIVLGFVGFLFVILMRRKSAAASK